MGKKHNTVLKSRSDKREIGINRAIKPSSEKPTKDGILALFQCGLNDWEKTRNKPNAIKSMCSG